MEVRRSAKANVLIVIVIVLVSMLFLFSIFNFSINKNCIEIELEVSEDMKIFADGLSEYIVSLGSINTSLFKDNYPEEIRRLVLQLNHVVRSINEKFNLDLPTLSLNENIVGLAKLGGYVLLGVNTYNKLYEASQSLPSNDESNYIVFYTYLVLFFVDLVVIHSKLSYKIAFDLTREISIFLKFPKFAKALGWKVVGAMMSVVHWRIRYFTEGGFEKLESQFIDAVKSFKKVKVCIG